MQSQRTQRQNDILDPRTCARITEAVNQSASPPWVSKDLHSNKLWFLYPVDQDAKAIMTAFTSKLTLSNSNEEQLAAFISDNEAHLEKIRCRINSDGATALHIAARYNPTLIPMLIPMLNIQKSDMGILDVQGQTVLDILLEYHYETLDNCVDVITILLLHGSDPNNIHSQYGSSLLCCLARKYPSLVVHFFNLRHHPCIENIALNKADALSYLLDNHSSPYIEAAIQFIQSDRSVRNTQSHDREETILHVVLQHQRERIADVLALGVDVNIASVQGTPLQLSFARNDEVDFETAILLIEAGANKDTQDFTGETLLHVAARENLLFVPVLLQRYLDPSIQDTLFFRTPFSYLLDHRPVDFTLVSLFLNKNVDPNTRNGIGQTVLHIAAEQNPLLIPELLQRGVDPSLKIFNEIALDVLLRRPWYDVNKEIEIFEIAIQLLECSNAIKSHGQRLRWRAQAIKSESDQDTILQKLTVLGVTAPERPSPIPLKIPVIKQIVLDPRLITSTEESTTAVMAALTSSVPTTPPVIELQAQPTIGEDHPEEHTPDTVFSQLENTLREFYRHHPIIAPALAVAGVGFFVTGIAAAIVFGGGALSIPALMSVAKMIIGYVASLKICGLTGVAAKVAGMTAASLILPVIGVLLGGAVGFLRIDATVDSPAQDVSEEKVSATITTASQLSTTNTSTYQLPPSSSHDTVVSTVSTVSMFVPACPGSREPQADTSENSRDNWCVLI